MASGDGGGEDLSRAAAGTIPAPVLPEAPKPPPSASAAALEPASSEPSPPAPAPAPDAGAELAEVVQGEVLLRVTPWAMVFVDGRALGEVTGRRVLRLPPGKHRVRFEHPRKNVEKVLEIRGRGRTSFEFNALKKP